MLYAVFNVLLLALVVRIVYVFATQYRKAEGTQIDKILQAADGSATILWSRFVSLVASSSSLLCVVADYLDAPGIKDQIQAILKPEYVAWTLLGMAVITEMSRRRTLNEKV
jgi:hypothetical protein